MRQADLLERGVIKVWSQGIRSEFPPEEPALIQRQRPAGQAVLPGVGLRGDAPAPQDGYRGQRGSADDAVFNELSARDCGRCDSSLICFLHGRCFVCQRFCSSSSYFAEILTMV